VLNLTSAADVRQTDQSSWRHRSAQQQIARNPVIVKANDNVTQRDLMQRNVTYRDSVPKGHDHSWRPHRPSFAYWLNSMVTWPTESRATEGLMAGVPPNDIRWIFDAIGSFDFRLVCFMFRALYKSVGLDAERHSVDCNVQRLVGVYWACCGLVGVLFWQRIQRARVRCLLIAMVSRSFLYILYIL